MHMISSPRSAFAATIVAVLGLTACDEAETVATETEASARPVKTVIVKTGDASLRFVYPATVAASDEADLSFRVPGKMIELLVRAGDEVTAGQTIARLDPRDFTAEVTRLQAQLAQAQAQLAALRSGARVEDVASLRAALDAAKAQFREAQGQARRTRELYTKQIVAKAAYERDLSALRVANAQVQARQQDLVKGQAGGRPEELEAQEAVIAGIQAQIASAEDALNDTILRAPFAGYIASRKVENFTNVQAKETVVSLESNAGLELIFDVPGPDVAKIGEDNPTLQTYAILDAMPEQRFDAELVEFSLEVDPATQTYQGRVAINAPSDLPILSGMAGRLFASIAGSASSGVVLPATAIGASEDGTAFVWVVNGEPLRVERRAVTLGTAGGETVSVLTGISPGEQVVAAGVARLQPGVAVRPLEKTGR